MTPEIKKLQQEIREWESIKAKQSGIDDFAATVAIKKLKDKVKRLKRGEDI